MGHLVPRAPVDGQVQPVHHGHARDDGPRRNEHGLAGERLRRFDGFGEQVEAYDGEHDAACEDSSRLTVRFDSLLNSRAHDCRPTPCRRSGNERDDGDEHERP